MKLSDVGAWLDSRYGSYARLGAGWNDPERMVTALFRSGVRTRGFRDCVRELLPGVPTSIRALDNTVEFQATRPAQGMMLPVISRVTYTDVELQVTSLACFCDEEFGPPVVSEHQPALKRAGGPGRTPKYDWPSAYAAISAKDIYEDFAPNLFADGALATIEAELRDWFATQAAVPAESLIREHATKWRDVTAREREKAQNDQ